jgi:antitoxin ParD1/3/4
MTTITLPPDIKAKVEARIASGAASDAAEVIRSGLEALEAAEQAKLAALRAKIDKAISDPRPSIPAKETLDRVDAALEAFLRK